MGKYLTLEERNLVVKLHKEGIPQKDIAKLMGRSTGAICYLVNHAKDKKEFIPYKHKTPNAERVKEMDLASLPDTKIFKHERLAIP